MRRLLLGVAAAAVLAGGVGAAVVVEDRRTPTPAAASPSPEPSRTPLLTAPAGGTVPSPAGLRTALATALADKGLGTRVALSVLDVATGRPLLEVGATTAVTPASTAKLPTAVAALLVLEPDRRFTTKVLQGPPGTAVLVGGGDPTLAGANAAKGAYPAPARLAALAAPLKGITRVVVDDSLFAGPRTGPGWKPGYVTRGDVAPVSALAVDAGRTSTKKNQPRSADPALAAGRQLAALLGVTAPVTRGTAPAGAPVLAQVQSPTVAQLVEAMLVRSDNDLAEALGRHVALAGKQPATFAGEVVAIGRALAELVPSGLALQDASGLSPQSRLQPAALTRLLAAIGSRPGLGPVLSGLPVAGFDGTLEKRYRSAPTSVAAGVVRAKTGTLDGVSALAGLVRTRSGALLAFDATANGVPLTGTLAAQQALDRIATVLASCGCA